MRLQHYPALQSELCAKMVEYSNEVRHLFMGDATDKLANTTQSAPVGRLDHEVSAPGPTGDIAYCLRSGSGIGLSGKPFYAC